MLMEICELFRSPRFHVLTIVEYVMKASTCPSIAHDPNKVAEWALVVDHVKRMLANNPGLSVEDIITHINGQIRNK